eukprot:CAMPEP_0170551682 /NCGR_PEP_ID=MMETSP0211-20121228/9684_1 /TAXON_ID=311385 /ORGANISM="Pseudokeronopsis sp., Strain OXSARD2" /LENGTH=137 /DNA_ID=CAMNT_0010859009 /DNA_START=610 /DNA_END=1023 /DNA_ORIENTATION=+
MSKLNPIDYVNKCYTPALFVVAKGDDFVRPHHGEMLFNKYAGDKNIIRVEGDHNSERPLFMLDSVAIFFYQILQCDKLPQLDETAINDDIFLLRLDQVLEDQARDHSNKVLLEQKLRNEDEEYKSAVIDSLQNMYEE